MPSGNIVRTITDTAAVASWLALPTVLSEAGSARLPLMPKIHHPEIVASCDVRH